MVRLGDTCLSLAVEKDYAVYGEELKFGGLRNNNNNDQICNNNDNNNNEQRHTSQKVEKLFVTEWGKCQEETNTIASI